MTSNLPSIERLIPHRLPMRLVEAVEHADESSIQTSATVRASWPTVENGTARTLVLIEVLAQSAAALQGWRERNETGQGLGGLLVGIPSATLAESTIPLDTRLCCRVEITHGVPGYLAFEGTVVDDQGKRWLSASIQAFRPDMFTAGQSSP